MEEAGVCPNVVTFQLVQLFETSSERVALQVKQKEDIRDLPGPLEARGETKAGEERRKGVEAEAAAIAAPAVVAAVVRVIAGGAEASTGFLKGNTRGATGISITMKNGLTYKGTTESLRRHWKS